MVHLATEQRYKDGKEIPNNRLISNLIGFNKKDYQKLKPYEYFNLDGMACCNKDFKLMKIYRNKKYHKSFVLIQNDLINFLTFEHEE